MDNRFTKSTLNKSLDKQRRQFMVNSVLAGTTLSLASGVNLFAGEGTAEKALNILFLGGTGFIGPHMVRQCLARGHKVTLFNRGKRNRDLFPKLETIIGNRDPKIDQGLKGLEGRKWDAVIDTSGYVPRHVEASSALLAKAAPHYLYISTVAVYKDFLKKNMDEDSPLAEIDDPTSEDVGKYYGALKVLCEQRVRENFSKAATILRPTFIVGPGDHTDRFIHYFDRPMKGGRMAMPGTPENDVGYVDVRDLAEHVVRSLENIKPGIYNMVNKPMAANFGELMKQSIALSKSDVELIWMDQAFLSKQEEIGDSIFGPFPMWVSSETGFSTESQKRAVANVPCHHVCGLR
jgi:2'-hydroxyisoflavone reductase